MSRSPLFSLFKTAHRALRHSRDSGVPLNAAALSASFTSRRRFLQATGAVSLAAALPVLGAGSCETIEPPSDTRKRVAIVGAGMAGLHCALRLEEAAADRLIITLFEAQERVGGRMFSDRSTFAPLHCELGGELIDSGHTTMRDLAAEFGLTLLDFADDDQTLESIVAQFSGARVSVADILTAYAPIAARIDADLATITGDGYVTYDAPNNGEALDVQTIKGWFDALVTDGTITADNIARRLFEVAFNIEYGRETDEQSVLNMMVLTSTDTGELAVFGESDERYHIAEGNDALITKMHEALSSETRFKYRLTALSRNADGVFVLTFDNDGATVTTEADEVVIALPFTIVRDIDIADSVTLSPQKRLAIDNIGYGTNAKLMLGFTSQFWRNKKGVNTSNGETFSDTGYQATWETSRLQGGDAGIITNFTGGDRGVSVGEGTPESQATRFLLEFETVFPGVSATYNDKLARFHWPTNPFVKASYACYLPGQYSTICGAEIESEADGHLHFCGEHTSLDAQGYMEGAALTGAAAAVAVVDNLGSAASAALLVDTPVWQRARKVRARIPLRRRR